jgi:hypothetical protein
MRINNNQINYFNNDVLIYGSLSALSGTTFTNTIFTTTSALSVINTGTGPALYVSQAPGNYDIASFYDRDGVEVLHVGNAFNGLSGRIGINESNPGAELTVNGAISSKGGITAAGGTSDQWNTAYAFTTNIPLVTAFKITGVTLGTQGNTATFYTVPAGKTFACTCVNFIFDTGAYLPTTTAPTLRVITNATAGNTVIPNVSLSNVVTYAANSMSRFVTTGNSAGSNSVLAVAGDTLQVRVQTAAAVAYTASIIVEGYLF